MTEWRGLSLTQPWATLVALGQKRIETRSWRTHYRGRVAIHASKIFPRECRELCREPPFSNVLFRAGGQRLDDLPRGAIVATAVLDFCGEFKSRLFPDAVRPFSMLAVHEEQFGNFAVGRFGFEFRQVRRLETPIPCRGALGLWRVPDSICEQLENLR